MFRLADVLFFHGRPILPDSPRPLNNAKTAGSVEGNRRAAALFNKPHHPTTRSRPVSMIFRNSNTNPAIHARPRF
jgi:hypothetical protein